MDQVIHSKLSRRAPARRDPTFKKRKTKNPGGVALFRGKKKNFLNIKPTPFCGPAPRRAATQGSSTENQ